MTGVLVMPPALHDRLPALRERLEQERAFRLDQLSLPDNAPEDPALQEVEEMVAASATMALNDIEIALLRIDVGSYGFCQSCHAEIPVHLLESIPQTRLCLNCRATETDLVEIWG